MQTVVSRRQHHSQRFKKMKKQNLYISYNTVGMVLSSYPFGYDFWRVYNGYTKREAIARYKEELRQKLGVKRLPFGFREVKE